MITYPASTGRNFDDILRGIDSLQFTAEHQVATTVGWKDSDDVITVPALSNDEAKERLPNGWKELKPFVQVTAQPNV